MTPSGRRVPPARGWAGHGGRAPHPSEPGPHDHTSSRDGRRPAGTRTLSHRRTDTSMRENDERGSATTPNPAHATDASVTALTGRQSTGTHRRPPRARRWARLIANKYGLTLPEAHAELRRCAAGGWQLWEFHTRFNDRKDTTA